MIAFLASLGLAQRLKSALPYIGAGIAVLLLLGALWLRGDHFRNQRDEARTATKEQVAEYRRVYNETFAKHWAAKLAEDRRRQATTMEADNATTPRRTDALASAAAHADRWQVRRPAADPGSANGSDLPGSPAPAGSAASSTPIAGMVAISRADLDNCTLNSADLGIAYEWANKLVPPGTAESPPH